MAVIRFDPNTPVEVALKYDAGKQVKSRIEGAADQMMYTLCGDDTIYLPLIAAEKITQLGIKKLELITITKRQQGTMTKWEVKRLVDEPPPTPFDALPTAIDATPIERKLTASINQAQQRKASPLTAQPPAVATVPVQAISKQEQTQQSNSTPVHHTAISRMMASALCAAIDATQEAEGYAHSRGIEVEFGSDDIRAISNTIFIAISKDPAYLTAAPRSNGAASWQQ